MDKTQLEQLEALVDQHGMQGVVDALVEIAQAKAEHVASAWQDEASAARWVMMAEVLDAIVVSA